MSYKTILLHLDNEAHAPALTRFACNVASQHGAHLVGMFVIHPLQMYVGRAGGVGISSDISSLLAKQQFKRMKELEAIFTEETKDQDFIAEWRFVDERIETVADTVIFEAGAADLLIIGQQETNYLSKEIAHSALLGSPVPVLIVPEGYKGETFGQNILVAWDGKPEAARSVIGAMPLIQSADNVWLHNVRTSVDPNPVMQSNIKCVAENLSRHGVKAEISESTASNKDVGVSIAGVVKDRAIDGVVMGAYGHSKIKSMFLGNTTDYALKNFTTPLLMWH